MFATSRKTLFLLAGCLVAAVSTPRAASAQADSSFAQQFLTMKAQIDTLMRIVGEFRTRPDLSVRCTELPNGECPVLYRQRQLGVAADNAYEHVLPGFQAQLSGIAARVGAIESQVAAGQPVGTAVFDRIRANKVCIGDIDCDGDWNADIQVRKNKSAVIGLEANLDHTDPQDPTHTHVSQFSLSQDGGPRIQQNAQSTYSRGFVAMVNPCRPWGNFGPDSRSGFSIYVGQVNESTCTPIPHDGAQDFVFLTDEVNRRSVIFMSRANWRLYFLCSSAIHAGDIACPAPQQ